MRQRHAISLRVILDRRVKLAYRREFRENLDKVFAWLRSQGWRD